MKKDLLYFSLCLSLSTTCAAFIPARPLKQGPRLSLPGNPIANNVVQGRQFLGSSSSSSKTSLEPWAIHESARSVRDHDANHRMLAGILNKLEVIYSQANSDIPCPFFRRRVADFIDNVAMVARFLVIRHKSLFNGMPLELEIPGCKAIGRHVLTNPDGTVCKYKNLPSDQIYQIILSDWSTDNSKGYYITGRLNSTIYRDDCLFDGPDPDMPVRGLRKYLAAASHLFDARHSSAHLLELHSCDQGGNYAHGLIEARWKIEGTLMLPWRPVVQPWTGWTRYHVDEDGMIALHEEGWDISVLEAFLGVMLPDLWKTIYGKENKCAAL